MTSMAGTMFVLKDKRGLTPTRITVKEHSLPTSPWCSHTLLQLNKTFNVCLFVLLGGTNSETDDEHYLCSQASAHHA